jgi:hypothetical protein
LPSDPSKSRVGGFLPPPDEWGDVYGNSGKMKNVLAADDPAVLVSEVGED